MPNSTVAVWGPNFSVASPIFAIFSAFHFLTTKPQWPVLFDYNRSLVFSPKPIMTASGHPIQFIEQMRTIKTFAEHYEPLIYLSGKIQVREHNWHDFFNTLVWLAFPKMKAAINEQHYLAFKQRFNRVSIRSTQENALAHFDENGIVVVSKSQHLLELIKNHEWKRLFWENRDKVLSEIKFFIFGHSLYEKALNPYIGMTGTGKLILEDDFFFNQDLLAQVEIIDEKISNAIKNQVAMLSPKEFSPVPVLGIPGWFAANEQATFYDNKKYFRSAPLQVLADQQALKS